MKAVIMAGGEGSRLRPITCDRPKPMAEVCGHPVIEYILELLIRHSFDTAHVTLRYLPDKIRERFPDGSYKGMKLKFFEEDMPLGTAGSVKNAAGFNEDFLIISGDAICDTDLTAAMNYHKSTGADATIITTHVADPREYGLVSVNDGVVTGFIEKPSYSGVTTDLANTGIYILSPKVLQLIPENRTYDFACNLFPAMLKKGMRIMSWVSHEYWCDIGDLKSYLKSQNDVLEKRVFSPFLPDSEKGIYTDHELPAGVKIFPPVLIGRSVSIGEDAVIGPCAVISDGATVGDGARVRGSVVGRGASIGENARLTGAIVCSGAAVKKGASMYEESAVGSAGIIGENAEIMQGISVWPGKSVEAGAVVKDNLRYGTARRELFDDDGIGGEIGVDMTPELCAKIGAAAGTLKDGSKVGVACDFTTCAKMLKSAFLAGVASTGSGIYDFGQMTEAQLAFASAECELSAAAYITGEKRAVVKFFGSSGLPFTRAQERELQNHFLRGEFIRCSAAGFSAPSDMTFMNDIYLSRLLSMAPDGLTGISATAVCSREETNRLINEVLSRLGCRKNSGPIFTVSRDGMTITACSDAGRYISYERLLTLCCVLEFERGHDVVLPYSAPRIIDSIAQEHQRQVFRFLSCPASEHPESVHTLSKTYLWLRDGMMMTVYLLSAIKRLGCDLDELIKKVPKFFTAERHIPINAPAASVMGSLGLDGRNDGEGILSENDDCCVLIHPSKRGDVLRLTAEAADSETAEEMCAFIEGKLR